MSRQDKATTERNARTLRDLVRQPDNKACADCHKNDARWASWNLGVFLCIRCSGIHRAMGTHISKVKSIDLDIWTPEQMDNVQKWGNRRANLYWEKHLKKGHNPPDHKIESFIRSKYESRRWAMEGPLPRDPSALEQAGGAPTPVETQQQQSPRPTPTSAAPPAAAPGHRSHPLLSRQTGRPTVSPARAAPPPPAPAPIIDLFGEDNSPAAAPTARPAAPAARSPATTAGAAPAPTPATAASPAQPQGSNIFDLDFKAPAAPVKQQAAKADIMSLFSQAPAQPAVSGGFFNASAPAPTANPYGSWNGGITSTASTSPQQNTAPVPTWNDQAAWGAPAQATQQRPQQAQAQSSFNTWASPTQQQTNNSSNLWGQPAAADPWATPAQPTQPPVQKKAERDPFANIWG